MRKYVVSLLSLGLLLGACNESCHDWSSVTAQPPGASSNETGDDAPSQNKEDGAHHEADDSNDNGSNHDVSGDAANNNTSDENVNHDSDNVEINNNSNNSNNSSNNSNNAPNEDDHGESNDNGSQNASDTDDGVSTGEAAQALSLPGLDNLYRVSEKLYRSAQPMQGGLVSAQTLGIRTVLSLQIVDFDSGLDETAELSLSLVHVPMMPSSVTDEDVLKALRAIQASDGPVLVHCLHGADRTGTVVAMYRVVFQNWSKDRAIDEMTNGGFGYHVEYANLVELIRRADIAAYRQALGL